MDARLLIMTSLGLAGCLRSSSVPCDDGRICPRDRVCDEVHQACVLADQLTSCVGAPDVMTCDINGKPVGICDREVCVYPVCGDHVVYGEEACDGAAPQIGTCVDFDFGYGALTCSALCTDGFDACRQLGWRFRAPPGAGDVTAMAQDGGAIWVATPTGILRGDGTAWIDLGRVTATSIAYSAIWAGGGQVVAVGNAGTNGYVVRFDGTSWVETPIANVELRGVWARGATDVFAVGVDAGGVGRIYHDDGTGWTASTTASAPPRLNGVGGSGASVFAVGDASTILELTGTTWSQPMTVVGALPVVAVWASAPDDVYAVGDRKILHLDAASRVWTPMERVPPGNFHAISGRAADEIYVVGDHVDNTELLSSVLYYDGTGWTPMITPSLDAMTAVTAGPAGVFAARSREAFLAYQGVGWAEAVPRPAVPIGHLWGSGPGFVVGVAGGCSVYEDKPLQAGMAAAWNQLQLSCPLSTTPLLAVWGSSRDDVYAGGAGVMFHRVSDAWTTRAIPNGKSIHGIWGASATDIYAVGSDAQDSEPNLLHDTGAGFVDDSDQVRPLATTLRGVWGSSGTDVFAVGGGGAILHGDGTGWTAMASHVTADLAAVWGSGPSDVYAVGDRTVLHYDGTAWSAVAIALGTTIPTQTAFADVNGTGPNDVYIVGLRTLLHFDGTTWSPVARPDSSDLASVWATGHHVFVSGAAGAGDVLVGELAR